MLFFTSIEGAKSEPFLEMGNFLRSHPDFVQNRPQGTLKKIIQEGAVYPGVNT